MSLDTLWSLSLVACSLFLTVQGGYEGSSKGRYDDRPRVGYDDRVRVGYEGRPRVMLGETPLAGIIRPVPLGSLVPTFHSQCCPCPAVNRIYPDRYHVINGNQAPPPLIDLPSFNAGAPFLLSPPSIPVPVPSEVEPTPESNEGPNGGGDRWVPIYHTVTTTASRECCPLQQIDPI